MKCLIALVCKPPLSQAFIFFLQPRAVTDTATPSMLRFLFFLLARATAPVLAASRTSAPPGCLTVGKASGAYSTVQSAVDALSVTSKAAQCIFISPGTYKEQVLVPPRAAQLSIYGSTSDTSGHAGNTVTITASKSLAGEPSDDATGTLRVKAANFRLYNVNVNNGFGEGQQAIALSAYADSGYYGCAFTGFQDTVLAQQGYQLYSKCLIQGATDFVFGQNSPAWFEQCDIRVLTKDQGYVTGKYLQTPRDGSESRATNTDSSFRSRLAFGHQLLRLQLMQHRRCSGEHCGPRFLLPRPALGQVCTRHVPKDVYDQRHQPGRMARLGRNHSHERRAVRRERQHGRWGIRHQSQFFAEIERPCVDYHHFGKRLYQRRILRRIVHVNSGFLHRGRAVLRMQSL